MPHVLDVDGCPGGDQDAGHLGLAVGDAIKQRRATVGVCASM